MKMETVPLSRIAYARSGDKGSSANIAVMAYTSNGYECMKQYLTANRVQEYFKPLGVIETVRYDLPHLLAFNFVLKGVLDGGASRSLRIDAQGKALAQVLLEMPISISVECA